MLSTIRRIGSRCAHAFACTRRQLHAAVALIAIATAALFAGLGQAGQERYDYDPIGRLIRFTDSNNEVTEYTYDKAGNITSVVRGAAGSNQPPVLSAISPSVIRIGQTASFTITGQRLQVGTLQVSDPGIDLSNLQQSATQLLGDLAVAASVPTGTQTLTFTNGQGTATIGLLIAPKLPTLSVEPSPLALPPDNVARGITLRISNPDLVAHQLTVTSSDTTRATVSPSSVTIPAGQTSVQVSVTPKLSGFTNLTITSPTLKTVSAPVFVTSDFRGLNTSYAMPLGVRVGDEVAPSAPSTSATFKVNALGVVLGPVLTDVAPRGVSVGGTYTFTISGAAIPDGAQVSWFPGTGAAVQAIASSPTQITATVSIDAAAEAGLRRFVVKDAAGNLIPFADPSAATVRVTTGQPRIISVEPLFTTRGNIQQIRVRGANLQGAQVRLLPAIDTAVDSAPSINAAGTELTVRVWTSPLAALGPRTVQVITPSGDSGTTVTEANQYTLVSEIKPDAVTPIFAPAVGVQVGDTSAAPNTTTGPFAGGPVGVVVGAAAHDASPKVAVVGESATLVVQGTSLQGVTGVTLLPGTGITYGALAVSADGTSLSMPITVDAAAARGMRRVVVTTSAGRLIFTNPTGDQVLVAKPAPVLTWVKPQVVQSGTTATMTLLGRNFFDVLGVSFDPPAGISTTSAPVATEEGTVLTFGVQASADAVSGTRTVLVTTSGGTSSAVAAPSNTMQVARQLGPKLETIFATPLGVRVGEPAPVTEPMDFHAPAVGVVFTPPVTEVTESRGAYASNVGVLVGTGSTGVLPRSPEGFLKGTTGTVTVTGHALDAVTGASVRGASGFAVGPPQVNVDGTQLTLAVSVPQTATSTYYTIALTTGVGTATAQVTPLYGHDMLFSVGALPTLINSIDPILVEPGKSYTLTVRGNNLRDVYQVVAEPAEGLTFSPDLLPPVFSTDQFGEKLTVRLRVDTTAPLGSRVIRLRVPGGITDAEPVPANTMTVVPPQ